MAKQFDFQPSKHPTLPEGYQRKNASADEQVEEVVKSAVRDTGTPRSHMICLALAVVVFAFSLLRGRMGWGGISICQAGGGLVMVWAVAQWFMSSKFLMPLISACLGAGAIALHLAWAPLLAGLMKQAGTQVKRRRAATRRF